MPRSLASQIEYRAMLGQTVEHTSLSAQEARTAIEQFESALKDRRATAPASLEALSALLLAAQTNSTLAQRVREVVRKNQEYTS